MNKITDPQERNVIFIDRMYAAFYATIHVKHIIGFLYVTNFKNSQHQITDVSTATHLTSPVTRCM